jgi:4-hydroxybenzoate polyprenyltransferase
MIPYLRLVRLPNVFTSFADIVAGFLIVRLVFSGGSWWPLLPLLLSSAGLYLSGTTLNDVADREEDARVRPDRPIPSGAVTPRGAVLCGAALWLGGVLCALLAGWAGASPWAPAAWALVLGLAILTYNFGTKGTWLGPPALGVCRFLNVQLGMSASAGFLANLGDAALWRTLHAPALAVGLYATGLTVFSVQEEAGRRTRALVLGWAFCGGALGLAAWTAPQVWGCPAFLLLAAALGGCTVRLARGGTAEAARDLVRTGVLGICLLDAGLILGHGGTAVWPFAVAVFLLLVPALLAARLLRQREA